MGRYIKIEKVYKKNGIYYYYVLSSRKCSIPFFIGIDPENKVVHYYSSENFDQRPIGTIDLNAENFFIQIGTLDQSEVNRAAIQAYLAIKNNDFPKDIGRYS